MNMSVSNLTCSNTCRTKYKKTFNLVALNSALKILDEIVKIYSPLTPYQTANTGRITNPKVI